MAEYGGLIEGEDSSTTDIELPEWMERELREGKTTWEDRLIPCLQCPHCQVIFAINLVDEAIKSSNFAV
jgi:hypothetical protein